MKNLRHSVHKHFSMPFSRSVVVILILIWVSLIPNGLPSAFANESSLGQQAVQQIQELMAEKAKRTPIQQKVSSRLLYQEKMMLGQPITQGIQTLQTQVDVDTLGTTLIDIQAEVTPEVLTHIESIGGTVLSSFPQYQSIRARIPLNQCSALAQLPEVEFIRPASQAMTDSHDIGAVNVTEGDVAHQADQARSTFGVDGTGISIGVLSDSVDFLADVQASGDLPSVTVLAGQSGVPRTGEGTAMLEIVHDLAPGANLLFATAFGGEANFANNIMALRAAGADVIVDDVRYFAEPAFQDGIIAKAVNEVTADGALYFASQGNGGNLNDGTSGVWEGDFSHTDLPAILGGEGVSAHNFGSSNFNRITKDPSRFITLQWSDPMGGSANDYDLYLLDSSGTNVIAVSDNTQNGAQNPFESINSETRNDDNNRIVIVLASGVSRFLRLSTHRGELSDATEGATFGHSASLSAVSVAAVRASTAGGGPFIGGPTNPVETFSSDGPRRVFFQEDGTPWTPGDFSSTGGLVIQKPNISAADGVSTATPGFSSFFGTSAAAPHAAGIAALLLGANSSLIPAQVRVFMNDTALDIEEPGLDRDSGFGIVNAFEAVQAAVIGAVTFQLDVVVDGEGSGRIQTLFPAGIDCGFDCSETYEKGTLIHLTAEAEPGSIFTGWSGGGCSGTGACVFTLGNNELVTGTFGGASCTADSHEPDNSSLQATTLVSGIPKTHTICSIGDTDWSTFTLTEASGIVLETSDSQGDTFMRLFDGALNELDSDNDGGVQSFSRIDRACGTDQTLSAGTYFVQVEEFGNNTTLEDYQLTLTQTPCGNVSAGTTSRVSVDSNGVEANLESFSPALNVSGNIVAFESDAFNLVPNDANDRTDIFVHDRGTNATTRVSVDSNGNEAGASSNSPALNRDGNIVAFDSSSTNLVANDNNLATDVFVHERSSGSTTRVSVDSAGVEGNGPSRFPAVNGNGHDIAFQSRATNLVLNDTNAAEDIFVHDRQTGTTTRVSVSSLDEQANNDSDNPDITPDGRYVAFSSFASNLVANDTNNTSDIFLHDRQTGMTTLMSVNSNGEQSDGSSSHPVLSADARFVAFHSDATNLDGLDDNFLEDVFVHDRQTGITTRISLDEAGNEGFDESRFPEISDDGQWIAFSSQNAFVANDTNGTGDIFLFDQVNGVMSRATVNSDGVGANKNSDSLALSGDGHVVAYSSQAFNLVPGDGNNEKDIFVHDIGASQELLRVDIAGNGTGTVSSAPSGISCPGDCTETYLRGTMVTLTAQEDPGSFFVGWSGCDAVNGKECVVTLTESITATVTFTLPVQFHSLTVTIEGTGIGEVTSSPIGIDCLGDCSEDFQEGTGVLLTANPDPGSTFVGFSGDPDCEDGVVTMDANKTCTATFELNPELAVVLAGVGSGTVTSLNPGIQCPADCSESLPFGSLATLTALPDSGSFFIGWIGCTPNPGNPLECSLTVTQDAEVTAEFGVAGIPDQVSFAVSSLGIAEDGGEIPILIKRTGAPGGAVSVDVTSGDGTALQGNDYTAVFETLVWGPTDFAPKTIFVPILNDTEEEGNETFSLNFSNPTGGVVMGALPAMAVTIVDTDSVPPASPLAGEWHGQSYADTRGLNFPDWVNGMIEVNEFGTIVGGMLTNSDGAVATVVAGAVTLNSDRTVTGWSTLSSGVTSVFEGSLDMHQTLLAGATIGSNNSRGLAMFLKKGETFSLNDIAGSYHIQSLGDARNVQFTIGVNGHLTSDELGNVSGQTFNTEGFMPEFSGNLTLDADGTVTGSLTNTNGPTFDSQGAMDTQKTIMSRVLASPQNSRRVFNVLVKRGTGFSTQQLAGTWQLFIARDLRDVNNPFSVQTTLTLDEAGLVTEGQHRISEGLTFAVTGGSFEFNDDDELVGSWTLENGVTFNSKGSMDVNKTFAATVGTGILGTNNIRNIALWVKKAQLVSLDVDGNGQADALTDGMLILRYLFGFKGQGLVNGVLALDAVRTTPEEILEYLDSVREVFLDVDGNGKADAFTDGMLIARFLMNFTGDSLIAGVVDPAGSRTTALAIQGFLGGFDPSGK